MNFIIMMNLISLIPKITAGWFLNFVLHWKTNLKNNILPETFSITKFFICMKLYEKLGIVKIFLKEKLICQLFSYCTWKKSKSFWIFVWIYFYWMKTAIFENKYSIMFCDHFYKSFENICKNYHKTWCCINFKNCSFYSIKKKIQTKIQKLLLLYHRQ